MLYLILYLPLEEHFFIILISNFLVQLHYTGTKVPTCILVKKNQQELLLTDNKIIMIFYASSLVTANIPFFACFIAIVCIAIEIIVI